MAGAFSLPNEYWLSLQITPQDVENLHTFLFERETPLTARDLSLEFIESRIKAERAIAESKQKAGGKNFLPKDKYQIGDDLIFPALAWKRGVVTALRAGVNPSADGFDVITVAMEDRSERMFAANLAVHFLNDAPVVTPENDEMNPLSILREHGDLVEKKLEAAFNADDGLVKIAGRWFPRALLIDINQGQLNLAEAVLDMTGGEPLTTEALFKDIELPVGVNPKLAEFSLNYALQDDERFDEVGPAGQVLWCLRRLEPDFVREVPPSLQYTNIEHDRQNLNDAMLNLEEQLDDELTPQGGIDSQKEITSVTVALIYPHLRAGTLPMSARAQKLFPTAYETPRVRFTLVDGKTKQRIPAWVVLEHGYVFGLREWYKAHQLIPGSLVQIKRGENPGEVIVEVKSQRSSKDWVRTVMVGKDGGFVFAMLKQPITAEFNDRMTIHVPDFKSLDPVWEKKRSFEELVLLVMRELTKSNPQGHVHAQELYAAVNLVRRVPPAPLFALLETNPVFKHVGDLHFRLNEE
ncbi:MAG: hypothetical protein IPL71_09690 [Anaerolineales bacterium]|uniref:hypothetical protein n=1 Tax=Candidatus Villigracilis proximus TaxID=3140683 RepID=UPI003135CDB4|nr:hypothetical protein [Anaerolineales bacterium]